MTTDPLTTEIRRAMAELTNAAPAGPDLATISLRRRTAPCRRPVIFAAASLAIAGSIGLAAVAIRDNRVIVSTEPEPTTQTTAQESVSPDIELADPTVSIPPATAATAAVVPPAVPVGLDHELAKVLIRALPESFSTLYVSSTAAMQPGTQVVAIDEVGRVVMAQYLTNAELTGPPPSEPEVAATRVGGGVLTLHCFIGTAPCDPAAGPSSPVDTNQVLNAMAEELTDPIVVDRVNESPTWHEAPLLRAALFRSLSDQSLRNVRIMRPIADGAWSFQIDPADGYSGLWFGVFNNSAGLGEVQQPGLVRLVRNGYVVIVVESDDSGLDLSEFAETAWSEFAAAVGQPPTSFRLAVQAVEPLGFDIVHQGRSPIGDGSADTVVALDPDGHVLEFAYLRNWQPDDGTVPLWVYDDRYAYAEVGEDAVRIHCQRAGRRCEPEFGAWPLDPQGLANQVAETANDLALTFPDLLKVNDGAPQVLDALREWGAAHDLSMTFGTSTDFGRWSVVFQSASGQPGASIEIFRDAPHVARLDSLTVASDVASVRQYRDGYLMSLAVVIDSNDADDSERIKLMADSLWATFRSGLALPCPVIYEVREGDYPLLLTDIFGVPWEEIAQVNGFEPENFQLTVGQLLVGPPCQ